MGCDWFMQGHCYDWQLETLGMRFCAHYLALKKKNVKYIYSLVVYYKSDDKMLDKVKQ